MNITCSQDASFYCFYDVYFVRFLLVENFESLDQENEPKWELNIDIFMSNGSRVYISMKDDSKAQLEEIKKVNEQLISKGIRPVNLYFPYQEVYVATIDHRSLAEL